MSFKQNLDSEILSWNLPELFSRNEDFLKDRPLLLQNNSDAYILFSMLVAEINELNGGEKKGYFRKRSRREIYRAQELADIILIVMSFLMALKKEVDNQFDRVVFDQANITANKYNIAVVDKSEPLVSPQMFNFRQHRTFKKLRNLLQGKTESLKEFDIDEFESDSFLILLQEILSVCFTMLYVLKLHPIKETTQKRARNFLKYPAADFQLPDNFNQLSEDEQFDIIRKTSQEARRNWQDEDTQDFFDFAHSPKTVWQRIRESFWNLLPPENHL